MANKPIMIIKLHEVTIVGHISFMTNNIDGIEVLNKLREVSLKLKDQIC